MASAPILRKVVRASGAHLHLQSGAKLVDGVAAWWAMCHGYNHPHIVSAMQAQLEKFSHIMFAGLTHEPAEMLAERLTKLTGLERVFFCDSGSIAVEVALKQALQFWLNKGEKNKTKFICFTDSYHGDTFAAMSVSDPENSMHAAFKDVVPKHFVFDIPNTDEEFEQFEKRIVKIKNEVAAMIIEPLMQGAGGMKFYSAERLKRLHEIAKKHDIIFIADEIATGFGRTGSMFACEQAGAKPDIMCLGKALTGGHIALAVTISSAKIFDAFLGEDNSTALMHGPTFTANPLACAAANASIDLFESEDILVKLKSLNEVMREELEKCRGHSKVIDVRVQGGVGVVQAQFDWKKTLELREFFAAHGAWLRPFGDIIYICPPYVISDSDLKFLCNKIYESLEIL